MSNSCISGYVLLPYLMDWEFEKKLRRRNLSVILSVSESAVPNIVQYFCMWCNGSSDGWEGWHICCICINGLLYTEVVLALFTYCSCQIFSVGGGQHKVHFDFLMTFEVAVCISHTYLDMSCLEEFRCAHICGYFSVGALWQIYWHSYDTLLMVCLTGVLWATWGHSLGLSGLVGWLVGCCAKTRMLGRHWAGSSAVNSSDLLTQSAVNSFIIPLGPHLFNFMLFQIFCCATFWSLPYQKGLVFLLLFFSKGMRIMLC